MILPIFWPSDNPCLISEVIEGLKKLPDKSIHCIVTSPPYWGVRDYGTATWEGGNPECNHKKNHFGSNPSEKQLSNHGSEGNARIIYNDICGKCGAIRIDNQLGLEETPQLYVQNLVKVFHEIWRILRDDGIVWLNLGDCYAGNRENSTKSSNAICGNTIIDCCVKFNKVSEGFKPKDRIGIPHRVIFALQDEGWYWRDEIVWNKPNAMPESVNDRTTKSHEFIFSLTKYNKYYYDHVAIMEPAEYDGRKKTTNNGSIKFKNGTYLPNEKKNTMHENSHERWQKNDNGNFVRNKRSVWSINTKSFKGSHFATFPPELPELCIKAGTSEKGCCPKCGNPWERIIVKEHIGSSEKRGAYKVGNSDKSQGNVYNIPHKIATKQYLGWKPNCNCYNIEIIEDPPKKPLEENKYETWKNDMTNWYIKFELLNKIYETLETNPCIVLDPFAGSGTTINVAEKLGRIGLGIDLNPSLNIHYRNRKAGKDVSKVMSLDTFLNSNEGSE